MPSSPARRKRGSAPHDQLSPDLLGKEVAVASSSTQQGAAKRQKRDGEFVLGSKSAADGNSAASKRPDVSGPAPAPQQQQLALFPKASRLERFCRDVFSVCGLLKPLEACLLWAQVEKQKSCKSKQKHLLEEEVDLAKHDWSRDRGRNPNPNAVGQPGHCVRHIQRYRRLYNEHAGKGDKVWFEGMYAQNSNRYERELVEFLHSKTAYLLFKKICSWIQACEAKQEFKQLPGVPTTAAARSGWALFVQDSWAKNTSSSWAGASSSGASSGAVFWKKLKADWANMPEASKAAYAERAVVAKEDERQHYEANVYPSPEYQQFAARQQKLKSGFYRGYLPRKVWQKLAKELELCVVCEEEGLVEDEDGAVEGRRCKEDVVFEMLEWFPTSAKDRTEVILKVRKLAGEWLEMNEDVEDVEEGDHSTESESEEDSSSADQHDVGENSSDEDGSRSCSSSDSDGERGGDEEKEGQASSHKSNSYRARGAVLTRAFIQRAQDEFRGVKLFSAGACRQPCAAKDLTGREEDDGNLLGADDDHILGSDVDLAKLAQELDVIIEENGDEVKHAPLDDPAANASPEQEEPELDSLLLQKGAHSLLPQEGRGRRSKRTAKVQFNGRKKVRKFGLGDLNEEKESCDVNIPTFDEESEVEVLSDHQQMNAAEEQEDDLVNLRQEKLEKLNAQLLRDKMLNSALTAKAFKKADLRAARSVGITAEEKKRLLKEEAAKNVRVQRQYGKRRVVIAYDDSSDEMDNSVSSGAAPLVNADDACAASSSSKRNKAKRNGNGNTPAAHGEEPEQHVVLQGILKNKNEPVKIDRNANAKATKQSGSCVLGGRKLRAGLVCFAGVDASELDGAGAGEGDIEEDHGVDHEQRSSDAVKAPSVQYIKKWKAQSNAGRMRDRLLAAAAAAAAEQERTEIDPKKKKAYSTHASYTKMLAARVDTDPLHVSRGWYAGESSKFEWGGIDLKQHGRAILTPKQIEIASAFGVGVGKKMQKEKASGLNSGGGGGKKVKEQKQPGKDHKPPVQDMAVEEEHVTDGVGILKYKLAADGPSNHKLALSPGKERSRTEGKGDSAHCSKKAGSSAVVKTVMKRARK